MFSYLFDMVDLIAVLVGGVITGLCDGVWLVCV